MHSLVRIAAAALMGGALLVTGPSARAQDEARPLVIGASQLFIIRNGDTLNGQEWSVRDRIGHVQDVFAKYLGGQMGKITWKKWGDRVHLYLNGDFVLAVTPADARATGYKSAEQLAPIWAKGLQNGFAGAHRLPTGSSR